MGICRKSLASWARWWKTQIKVNQTQVYEQMGHPVVCSSGGLLHITGEEILSLILKHVKHVEKRRKTLFKSEMNSVSTEWHHP